MLGEIRERVRGVKLWGNGVKIIICYVEEGI